MKKIISTLLIAGTLLIGSGIAQACDCEIATIPVDGREYAYTFFTVEGFSGDYVKLKSKINDESDYYYIGYITPGSELKVGREAVILYDQLDGFKITQILEVDND
ncbi:MAG: hypothetical protein K0R18_366 [Bacillales bacterium]|jgi:hypothetical protein|nr:hypothetical protein [Bacillales bacterium]